MDIELLYYYTGTPHLLCEKLILLNVFCLIEMCRSLGGEVTHDVEFMIFEGNRYSRKGFLFKTFAMSAVVSCHSICCTLNAEFKSLIIVKMAALCIE